MNPLLLEGRFLDRDADDQLCRLEVRGGLIRRLDPLDPLDPGASLPTSISSVRLGEEYRLLPGFIDAHTHLIGLGLEFLRPSFSGAISRTEVLARLDTWLRDHPGSDPVVGEGWDQSLWADPRPPDRAELDRVAPDRPVALRRVCGHVGVFNSAALASIGTEWEGLDVESGLALERLPLTIGRLWPPGRAMMAEGVRLGQEVAWRHGVTGIHEMGHPGTFRAFGQAAVAGTLRLRITHFFGAEHREVIEKAGLVPGFGSDRLRVGGIKIFLDGSIGGRSAAVRSPYPGDPPTGGGRGQLLWPDEALAEALRRAFADGYQAAMHAIGDAAIEQAIRVVERLRRDGITSPEPGPRLEHAEMLDADLLERAVAAGFLFCMQPNFTARWQGPGLLYDQVLGVERAARLNPYRSVARTGRLVFGSDTMPLGPLYGLGGALEHPLESERLDPRSARAGYTTHAAAAVTHPFDHGRLEPGRPADFIVLRRAPGRPETRRGGDEPASWEVAGTWFGGIRVHADAALAPLLADAGA